MSLDARALGGDVLALLGGMFGGVYIVTGGFVAARAEHGRLHERLLRRLRAAPARACAWSAAPPLGGYAAADWVRIATLTVTGQLLGHSLMNLVLRSISPTIVCLATLFTVPGAALIAAVDAGRDAAGRRRSRRSHCCSPGPRCVISARERAPAETP